MCKTIFVTGGVVSSLGKGIAAASIGCILEAHGYSVANIKLDPYLNHDPGTQSPMEHGEVYVTNDGAETDLDIGHYERFTSQTASRLSNFTTGQVYLTVIEKERRGEYLGKTVQVVPHITDEINGRIAAVAATGVDIVIAELGGTVGDIESLAYIEAMRLFALDVGRENVLHIHLALAPYIKAAQEIKTKPVQHSVRELREIGIIADMLLVRVEQPLPAESIEKIARFCNVSKDCVFQAVDVDNIYKVPEIYAEQYLDTAILNRFKMVPTREQQSYLKNWKTLGKKITAISKKTSWTTIGVVGKYIELNDAYKSIYESLKHAGYAHGVRIEIEKFDAENLTAEGLKKLAKMDGILVPGGFGARGIEGKIAACRLAREKNIPYFGICLGMQIAVIENARNVAGLKGANSTEFDPESPSPVISMMEEQKKLTNLGGTLRLGHYSCELASGSRAREAYKEKTISERHRHRYEFNNTFIDKLPGLNVTGTNPDTGLVEIVEYPQHKWFVGCQYHPEFKSRPLKPHPLFLAFVKAATCDSKAPTKRSKK